MNISLCGFYGKNNFGDDLMQECLSDVLSQKGQNKVTVFSDTNVNENIQNGLLNKDYLESDLIVIGGGGIVNSNFWIFKEVGLDELINSKSNIIFLNVNVYSDVLENKSFQHKLKLLNAKWWVRDNASKKILHKIGIDSIVLPDILFYKTTHTKPYSKKKLIFFPNFYAFPTGLDGKDISSWILLQRNISVISSYFNWLISFGWDITLSFAQHGEVDDRIIGAMIYAQIKDKFKVTWDVNIVDWQTKLDLIKKHNFVLSMRYHTSLAAVMNGIPCVDIVHHDKNKYFWEDLNFKGKTINMYTIDIQQLCEITNFSTDISCYLEKIDDYREEAILRWNGFEKIFKDIK